MTFETMANVIRSRFKTQIADVYSLLTQYDNQKFNAPDDAIWCRLTINYGETMQKSIGAPQSNLHRTIGIMTAQLFGPIGQGDGDMLDMTDNIKGSFRCVTDAGVVFSTPSIKNVGRVENYWQVNVHCPFYADDIG